MKADSFAAADIGATVLRLALGAMYLAHAGLKYFTFTMAGTVTDTSDGTSYVAFTLKAATLDAAARSRHCFSHVHSCAFR